MTNFQDMGLSPILIQALDKLGFTQPTSIQAKTIPLALQQKDILGSAQTGTGKTLAFALPLVNQLLNDPMSMGLILAPTRELAQQVAAHVNQLLFKSSFIKTALLIGGEPYNKQFAQLKANPRIIIGTPGRVIDHLQRNSFNPSSINFLVLDETDRMFDMGFSIQLEQIVSQLPTQRQTLMFSATFPPKVEKLAAKYMQTPERVFINEFDSMSLVAQNLTQEILEIKEEDKYFELLTQLNSREGTILLFVKTKDNAEHLSLRLNKEAYNTCAIHGNLRQTKRERVMRAFRQGRHQIMVATDIAARGLDVPHVKHVINYDIPHAPEDYIHRIGRTARAGAKGSAISFVSSQDRKRWNAIQDLLNPKQAKAERASEYSGSRGRNSKNNNSKSRSQSMGSSRFSQRDRFQNGSPSSRRDDNSGFSRSRSQDVNPSKGPQRDGFQRNSTSFRRDDNSGFSRPRSQDMNSTRGPQRDGSQRNSSPFRRDDNSGFSRPRSQDMNSPRGSQRDGFQRNSSPSRRDDNSGFSRPRSQDLDSSRGAPRDRGQRSSTSSRYGESTDFSRSRSQASASTRRDSQKGSPSSRRTETSSESSNRGFSNNRFGAKKRYQ
jgi:superfamily II DNA/RNA helicase